MTQKMESARKKSCFLYQTTLRFSQSHRIPQAGSWAQDVSAATSCSQQVSSEVTPGCSGLHPVGAWRPPRMETPPPLTVLMGKKFLLISQLKLSCFNSCALCLFFPPCTAVKSLSLSPWWPPRRHWGLLLGPLKPSLLQAEEGQLPQPLLKELRVEAKRRTGKTVVGPHHGATVLSGSLHVVPWSRREGALLKD